MTKNFKIDDLVFFTADPKRNQFLKAVLQKAFTHFYLTHDPIYYSALGKKGTTIITISVDDDAEAFLDCTFHIRYKSDGDSQTPMVKAAFKLRGYYAENDNGKITVRVDAIAEALTSDFYDRWL